MYCMEGSCTFVEGFGDLIPGVEEKRGVIRSIKSNALVLVDIILDEAATACKLLKYFLSFVML